MERAPPTPEAISTFFMALLPRVVERRRRLAARKAQCRDAAERNASGAPWRLTEDYLARKTRHDERVAAEAAQRKATEDKRRAEILASRAAKADTPTKPYTPSGPSHKEPSTRVREKANVRDAAKRAADKEASLARLAEQNAAKAEHERVHEETERVRLAMLEVGLAINGGR